MLIALLVVLGIFLFTAFMLLVVHPLACIVECAMSKQLSGAQKALWIAVTFFTGFLGAFVYALIGTSSRRLRSLTLKATGFCVAMGLVSGGLAFVSPSPMEAMKMASEEDKAKFAAAFETLESLEGLDVNGSTEAFLDAKQQVEKDLEEWGFAEGESTLETETDFGLPSETAEFAAADDDFSASEDAVETTFLTSTENVDDISPVAAEDLADEFFGDEMEFEVVETVPSLPATTSDWEAPVGTAATAEETKTALEDLQNQSVEKPVSASTESPPQQQQVVFQKPRVVNRYRNLPSYVPFQIQTPQRKVRNRYTGE